VYSNTYITHGKYDCVIIVVSVRSGPLLREIIK
jgi:hypothetical protein